MINWLLNMRKNTTDTKTMAITRLAHPYADLDGSFGWDDQLQLWITAGTNHRIIHGIFESKNRIAFSRHFYG